MKNQSLILLNLILISFSFFARTAHGYEEPSKVQRSIRDMIKLSPDIQAHVDRALKLFRDKEECGTVNEGKRDKGSKACTDLLTLDKAQAASAAALKACQAKCSAGAASALQVKAAKAKGAAALELAKCVDQACNDECAQKEKLFEIELDQYLKGTMMESLQMDTFKDKRGAYIWMNK